MTANNIHIHGEPKRKITPPKTVIEPLTDDALEYLTKTRKLNEETLIAFRLGCAKPKGVNEIVLPFYDENNVLQLIRFRHPTGGKIKRKEQRGDRWEDNEVKSAIEPGGRSTLFGSHLCDPEAGPLVLCFGDYDAMSVWQDGVPNAVGMPFGDGDRGFLDYQFDFINEFKEFVIYVDNDNYTKPEAKEQALKKLDELAKRLGKHRVRLVSRNPEDRYGTKDANELLMKMGEGFNRILVENAEPYPVGIVDVATYEGPPRAAGTPIGIPKIDQVTNGVAGGQLIVVGGDNESGKTTNVLNWMAHWIDLRNPVFLYSAEQSVDDIREVYELIIAGPDNIRSVTNPYTQYEELYPIPNSVRVMREWYQGYFYQYAEMSIEKTKFFEVAEVAVRRYGCKFIVVDNLMGFTGGEGEVYYQTQGDFAEACKGFAAEWNVVLVLLCHLRKMEEPKVLNRPRFPTKNDIEGNKKITNWADLVFLIYRVPDIFKNPPEDFKYQELSGVDAVTILDKNRKSGLKPKVKTHFNYKSKRLWQLADSEETNGEKRKFKWEDSF